MSGRIFLRQISYVFNRLTVSVYEDIHYSLRILTSVENLIKNYRGYSQNRIQKDKTSSFFLYQNKPMNFSNCNSKNILHYSKTRKKIYSFLSRILKKSSLKKKEDKNVSGEDYVCNWKALAIHMCFWNCFTPTKGDKTNAPICHEHTHEMIFYSKNKESLKWNHLNLWNAFFTRKIIDYQREMYLQSIQLTWE